MTDKLSVEETKKFYSTEEIPEQMKQALSFMRQWLNEDRKATPTVTARDLWHWLEKDYNNTLIQERERAEREHKKIKETWFNHGRRDLNKIAPCACTFDWDKEEMIETCLLHREEFDRIRAEERERIASLCYQLDTDGEKMYQLIYKEDSVAKE